MTTTKHKLRVGVIFGGRSSEHDISQKSAISILRSLNREKYEVTPIKITRTGQWVVGVSPNRSSSQQFKINDVDEEGFISLLDREPAYFHSLSFVPTDKSILISQDFDVIFPVLHGTYGEDGSIQGLFEVANVPYVGCGILGSALGMDKEKMKMIFRAQGLDTVNSRTYRRHCWENAPHSMMREIEQSLGYPCFVKPTNGGSSIGVSKVYNRHQLEQALQLAARYDQKIIVEQAINCRELSCSVLGNHDPVAYAIGETLVESDFYDYSAKYLDNTSQLIVPADIPKSLADQICQQAIKIFLTLDLCGLARVDFFLEKNTQRLFVNEVNTLPSLTPQCMYSRLCAAKGLSYSHLLDQLITLALERYADRQRNYTEICMPTLVGIPA